MQHLLRVVVVMGGPSGEHAISLKSGQGILEALSRRQWIAEAITIPQALSCDAACTWTRQALRRAGPDVVFLALHGPFGEDGTVQAVCDALHLAYTGSDASASRIGMNKLASLQRFEAAGLCVPRWKTQRTAARACLPSGWFYPIVVKPISQGSSLGVSLVRCEAELGPAIASAGQYGSQVLLEEFVQGREVTVGVLGDMTLPVIEIRPHQAFFDFTAKYTPGATDYLVPAPLTPRVAERIQAAGWKAHCAIGCRHLSRADFILRDDGTPVILEINTIPGFTPTSLLPKAAACIGLSYDELCEQVVIMACHPTTRLSEPVWQHTAHTGSAAG